MNLYEQLGIEQTADSAEIKRAYFRLIRKHTPENDPDNFMKIRNAYETLSDEKRRSQYDMGISKLADVPKEAAALITQAIELVARKLGGEAIGLIESSMKKHKKNRAAYNALRQTLCELYINAGKTGKAVDIAEDLVYDEPDNEKYLQLAIAACFERGWMDKADNYGKELLRVNPFNEGAILGLYGKNQENPYFYGKYVEDFEKNGKKAPLICQRALLFCLKNILVDQTDDRGKQPVAPDETQYEQTSLFACAENGQEETEPVRKAAGCRWDDAEFVAEKLAEHTAGIEKHIKSMTKDLLYYELLEDIFNTDKYVIKPSIDKVIENIGAADLYDTPEYKIVAVGYMALQAVGAGIPKTVAAYSTMKAFCSFEELGKFNIDESKHEAVCLELEILLSMPQLKNGIKRLQNEYEQLYSYSADFFDAAIKYNETRLMDEANRRITKLKYDDYRLDLDWLGEDDDLAIYREHPTEPVRVTKIGRNEPCPCGSGKKYKKCCGM